MALRHCVSVSTKTYTPVGLTHQAIGLTQLDPPSLVNLIVLFLHLAGSRIPLILSESLVKVAWRLLEQD